MLQALRRFWRRRYIGKRTVDWGRARRMGVSGVTRELFTLVFGLGVSRCRKVLCDRLSARRRLRLSVDLIMALMLPIRARPWMLELVRRSTLPSSLRRAPSYA
jgi:hypothetical protein